MIRAYKRLLSEVRRNPHGLPLAALAVANMIIFSAPLAVLAVAAEIVNL